MHIDHVTHRIVFIITTSTKGYQHKPTDAQMSIANYRRQELTLEQISELIRQGYTLSANFCMDGATEIGQTQRTYDNFESTCFVAFDMDDDCTFTLEELVDSLTLIPTLAYTTFSHQQPGKGNRYRLLYFFVDGINSIDEYRRIYDGICFDNNFHLNDNCGKVCVQAAFGSHFDCELTNTGKLYRTSDFSLTTMDVSDKKYHSDSIKKKRGTNNIDFERYFSDKEFQNDYFNMDFGELLLKYREVYCYFDHTPLPKVDDNTPYILLPPNYVEIRRYYWNEPIFDEKGNQIATYQMIRRIPYGENRRKKLYIGALLRRVMIPDVSFERLLYNMAYELFHHINNTEAVITKKDLLQTTVYAYKSEIYPSLMNRYVTTKKFIVNKSYCVAHHCNAYVARNRAVKLINHQRIAEYFNPSLKDKENLAVLRKHGIEISLMTLKRFRKEHGYTKNNKRKKTSETPIVDEQGNDTQSPPDAPITDAQEVGSTAPDGSQEVEESSGCNITVWPWQINEAVRILDMSLEDNEPENPDNLTQTERYHIYRLFAKRCRRFIHHDFPLEMCQKLFEERFGA